MDGGRDGPVEGLNYHCPDRLPQARADAVYEVVAGRRMSAAD